MIERRVTLSCRCWARKVQGLVTKIFALESVKNLKELRPLLQRPTYVATRFAVGLCGVSLVQFCSLRAKAWVLSHEQADTTAEGFPAAPEGAR